MSDELQQYFDLPPVEESIHLVDDRLPNEIAELSKQGANGTLYVYKGKEVKLIPSFARKIAYSSSRGSAAGRRKKQQTRQTAQEIQRPTRSNLMR